MKQERIFVSRSALPPLDELLPHLEQIWTSRVLTNGGQYHERFESALAEYLGVEHLTLVANGTLGLLLALRMFGAKGEVITTPFSFVATSHAISWSGFSPVFADIDPVSLNLDPSRIAAAITPETVAIMPVHCFGRPCDMQAIAEIGDKHNLPVIYDAAHAFGVRVNNESILRASALSVLSFHASKVFNSFEGGAIVSPDAETKRRLDLMRNYGIVDEVTIESLGINAKMCEFNAAVGLLQLARIDAAIAQRAAIAERYRESFANAAGIRCFETPAGHRANHCYFPILVEPEFQLTRDDLYRELKTQQIFARRYFYPLISEMPMYRSLPSANPNELPVAVQVANRILCLPLYPELSRADQQRVIDAIIR